MVRKLEDLPIERELTREEQQATVGGWGWGALILPYMEGDATDRSDATLSADGQFSWDPRGSA